MIFYAPRELVVGASIDPLPLAGSIRAIIRKIDPELPVARVRTVRDIVDQQTASRVTQLRVLQGFAALSLLLAGIGIHGLLCMPCRSAAARSGSAWRSAPTAASSSA